MIMPAFPWLSRFPLGRYSRVPHHNHQGRPMLRKLCQECDTEISRTYTTDGFSYTCQACGETAFVEVDMEPYCPDCGERVEFCVKCSAGFFCNSCRAMISSKRIVWKKA
ncbi:hypothetical protein Ppro_0839 [Pelobacter propionicus DSM 2379]|uniref:Uncharacterized protein n=2 Tax=Pelobacter propionicus TaxID=29543 RepID=A1AM98_PELPD|nr:hypothetical protein Ppro_0839 [Pelobacter propionicus DSM 2379]